MSFDFGEVPINGGDDVYFEFTPEGGDEVDITDWTLQAVLIPYTCDLVAGSTITKNNSSFSTSTRSTGIIRFVLARADTSGLSAYRTITVEVMRTDTDHYTTLVRGTLRLVW